MSKIRCDLRQLSLLTVNISGMHRDIDKQSTALSSKVHPELNKKNLANYGQQTKKL